GGGQDADRVRQRGGAGVRLLGVPSPDGAELQQAGRSVPGTLAVGEGHAIGQAETPRADRPAASVAGGRGGRRQPQPVLDRLGGLFPSRQLHNPVPQARPVRGRAAGTVCWTTPRIPTSTRARPLACSPAGLSRAATTRRTCPLWRREC